MRQVCMVVDSRVKDAGESSEMSMAVCLLTMPNLSELNLEGFK